MILEIALAIVLAVLILANLPTILALAAVAIAGLIALALLAGLVIVALDERFGPALMAVAAIAAVVAGGAWVVGRIRPVIVRKLGIGWNNLIAIGLLTLVLLFILGFAALAESAGERSIALWTGMVALGYLPAIGWTVRWARGVYQREGPDGHVSKVATQVPNGR
jgi:hypothetical protein